MKKEFLTNEERLYLEEHLEEIIELFKQAHDEIKEELNNKCCLVKKRLSSKTTTDLFFKDSITAYTRGYCFYFARIMKTIFMNYNFVMQPGHILLKNEERVFDITYEDQSYMYYYDADAKDLKRVRLGFREMDQELYEKLKYKFYRNIKSYLADKQVSNCKRLNK